MKAGTACWLAAALLLAFAWTDPHSVRTRERVEAFVVIDITQSMHTRDMALARTDVPRLAFVRTALQRAFATLPCGSRIALGVFTEYRTLPLLAPLEVCAFHEELLATLDRIDNRMAWAASSEVTRGVESALGVAHQLDGRPAVVFLSDGHESPPLRGGQLPTIDRPAPPLPGLLIGVGGDVPAPIPKIDPTGRALGFWQADEVMQSDPMSLGRTVGGAKQSLVDNDGAALASYPGSGQEHLSSLKEPHLRTLAQAAGLDYRRVREPADLAAALRSPVLARPLQTPVSWRWMPALAALILIVLPFVFPRKDRPR